MTSTNNDTRKLTDYPKVRGTTRRKVPARELRELGMWVESDPYRNYGWGRTRSDVWLAGAGSVGEVDRTDGGIGHAEVEEYAIRAALKLDVATNVKLAAQAQAAHRIAFVLSGIEVN